MIIWFVVFLLSTLFHCSVGNASDAHYQKGLRLKAEKQFQKAIESFEVAATVDPRSQSGLKARGEVGRCIFAAAGDAATPESELAHYNEAIRLAPRFGHAYVILANRLCARNRPREAVSVLRTALALGFPASHPVHASLYQVLGYAFFTMGNAQRHDLIRSAQLFVGKPQSNGVRFATETRLQQLTSLSIQQALTCS